MRAGLMLLLLVSLATYFLGLASVWQEVESVESYNLNPYKIFISTLEMLLFRTPTYYKPSNLFGVTIKVFAQILIPIQATFFALALRNKFRR